MLDEAFPFNELEDQGEEIALRRSLRSMDERVVFLQQDSRNIIGYRHRDEWTVRELVDSSSPEYISELIEYLSHVLDRVQPRSSDPTRRDYFSIRPLIYGGEYWLEDVSRRELNRFDDLGEEKDLSVLLLKWSADATLFSLVQSLRRGDRLGYFSGMVAAACPFTSPDEADVILERVQQQFLLSSTKRLTYRHQFQNHPELKAKVMTFQ